MRSKIAKQSCKSLEVRERVDTTKVGKLPACSAPPRDPSIPRDRRGINPKKGTVILTNGMEVPMSNREYAQWGKEKSRRYLTASEEKWQRGLDAEFEVEEIDETSRTCSRCGGPLSVIRPAPRPHWAELRCKPCGKFHGWLRTPDGELGRNYTMPFGKHRGKTLDEIAATDLGYLKWIASSDFDNKGIQISVCRYLGGMNPQALHREPVATG